MQVLRVFPCLVMAALLVGCDGQPVEPVPDEALTPLFKVDRQEYSFPIVLDDEDPWLECHGELIQEHGTLLVHIRETTTPSGNVIVSGWGVYNAVWLEGLTSGDVWTHTKGHQTFGEVIKEHGSYLLHYQWHDFFSAEDGEKLRVFVKGHVKIEPDGNVKIYRHSVECF